MVTPIINSAETIGDAYAPSLNAAFQELHDRFGFWPVVLAPYGGARTIAEQRAINPAINPLLSDHVKGRAVDIDNQRRFRDANQALFLSILAGHGWRNVQVDGSPFSAEPWHFANQSTNPAGGSATLITEEAMLTVVYRTLAGVNVYTIVGAGGTVPNAPMSLINLLSGQKMFTAAPSLKVTEAQHAELVAKFPPLGSGGAVVDIDEAALAAALGPFVASKADLTAAVTAIKAAIPTKFSAA